MQGKFPKTHFSDEGPQDASARVVSRLSCTEEGGGAGLLPEGLPRRMRVLAWGENANANGVRVHVGRKLLEAMASPTYPWGTVALDFEHNTVPGTPAYRDAAEPRPVAGYARVVAEEGVGVFIEMERWTPEGEAMAHHYEDLSAAPVCDGEGEVVGVSSVALCRSGAVPGIRFEPSPLSISTPPTQQPPKEETQEMDYKKLLLEALGLPEDASDEAIAGAFKALRDPEGAAPPEPDGGIAPLSARVEALERRADAAEREAVLAAARAEGKVVALSADAVAALTPAQLREHVAAIEATVPLSARTPSAVKEPSGGGEALRIHRLCGMTAEEVDKWA